MSPYRTGITTEMILFLSLFLQLKICLQGQVPRLGGANKVGVYRGIQWPEIGNISVIISGNKFSFL